MHRCSTCTRLKMMSTHKPVHTELLTSQRQGAMQQRVAAQDLRGRQRNSSTAVLAALRLWGSGKEL